MSKSLAIMRAQPMDGLKTAELLSHGVWAITNEYEIAAGGHVQYVHVTGVIALVYQLPAAVVALRPTVQLHLRVHAGQQLALNRDDLL